MTRPPQGNYHKGEARSAGQGANLSDDDIRAIRRSELSNQNLAKQYGVSHVMIHYIKTRKRWRHVQ